MHGTQIDQIFETHIGGLGLWQVGIILLISLSFSNNMILSVFFNSIPSHRCRADLALEAWLQNRNFNYVAQFLGPVEKSHNHYRQCRRYAGRAPANITISSLVNFYTSARNSGTPNYTCFDGYIYEYSKVQYQGGIVQQWDLVCDRAWQLPFNESAYMVGMLVGFILGGWMSDRLGRRRAIVISGCGEILASLFTALSVNHWLYVGGRVVLAAFVTARGSAYVVLSAEITTAKWRSILSAIGIVLQVITQGCLLGLLAQYVHNWRLFIIINAFPNLLIILHLCLLPESPRWLAACGRADKAVYILYSAYRCNLRFRRPPLTDVMTIDEFSHHLGLGPNGQEDIILRNLQLRALYSSSENSSEFAIWQLFKPHLIKTTLLSTSILTCQITCIFGMMFFANNIQLHVSFVTVVNSLSQIPGCILAAVLYRFCRSRKLPLLAVYVFAVIMGGIAAFHTMYFHPSTDTMLNAYSNIIILLLSAAQRMLFIYVPELYRPIYRNRGFGLAAGMARLGALWFPLINRLDKGVMHGLPLVVYTLIMTLQLVLLFFLEDTAGQARQSSVAIPTEAEEAAAQGTGGASANSA